MCVLMPSRSLPAACPRRFFSCVRIPTNCARRASSSDSSRVCSSGNGRTCGTCHPAQNNFTIDKPFVDTLPATDPLFVAETQASNLAALETPAIRMVDALIKENVDGFDPNQPGKFVSRAVSHTFSLATSLTRDPADGTSAAVPQRTGWGGDGAPDGTLRTFVDGAIRQHLTQKLDRVVGRDFRLPTNTERDQILAFQLALGRTADINLNQVTLSDAGAAAGKTAFMDPLQGRCNECHANGGANALASEWKYVPVRRTASYILRSLSEGLRWAVHKPNGEQLWSQLRLNSRSAPRSHEFLATLSHSGGVLGTVSDSIFRCAVQ